MTFDAARCCIKGHSFFEQAFTINNTALYARAGGLLTFF
jgi:hypothetical protein